MFLQQSDLRMWVHDLVCSLLSHSFPQPPSLSFTLPPLSPFSFSLSSCKVSYLPFQFQSWNRKSTRRSFVILGKKRAAPLSLVRIPSIKVEKVLAAGLFIEKNKTHTHCCWHIAHLWDLAILYSNTGRFQYQHSSTSQKINIMDVLWN